MPRVTIGSDVRAKKCYPAYNSSKSQTSDINIDLSDDEALKLARHIIQGVRVNGEVTPRVIRKPTPNHDYRVTVTCRR